MSQSLQVSEPQVIRGYPSGTDITPSQTAVSQTIIDTGDVISNEYYFFLGNGNWDITYVTEE